MAESKDTPAHVGLYEYHHRARKEKVRETVDGKLVQKEITVFEETEPRLLLCLEDTNPHLNDYVTARKTRAIHDAEREGRELPLFRLMRIVKGKPVEEIA